MHFNYNIKWDIVKRSKMFFWISGIITVLGIVSLLVFGLNLGVDFKAGTTLDISASGQTIESAKVQQILKDNGLEHGAPTYGGERVSIRFDKVLEKEQVNQVKAGFVSAYGDKVSLEENTVDASLAKELAVKGIYAMLIASIGIVIYLAIRFEWRFGVAAVISILHDAFIVVSLFSIFQWEVNLTFIAAILTIIGYSINDTIVIFDRLRENLRFTKVRSHADLEMLVNSSIWSTMTRSINTVLTVFIGALLLFIMGSESIRHFSLAMVIGLVCGAYSSIFIASPIWLVLKEKSFDRKKLSTAKD